jgi:hypothetical protein
VVAPSFIGIDPLCLNQEDLGEIHKKTKEGPKTATEHG